MDRRELLKGIRLVAKLRGVELELMREGAEHSLYAVGRHQFAVPRHRHINEHTARSILKGVEQALSDMEQT